MQLFVVVPDGSSSVVEIASDATVGALKHVIEDVQFVPVDQQQIAFSEEILDEDDECLMDCGLTTGASVELTLAVYGGGGSDGSRYKKSTSKFRWKWKKKRTRRLQRKRRKMRQRAR